MMQMTEPILDVRSLSKMYDGVPAAKGISFCVGAGEIVGLLGPNGAGKTTTINMILSILEPDAGEVRILGKDLKRNRSSLLEEVNFAAVYAQIPGNLTVRQNLIVFGMIYGVRELTSAIAALLQELALERFADTKVGFLSSGEQTRVSLAKALLNTPRLLLLDEPTASLDPSTAQIIREKIIRYAHTHNAGILWTSHNMFEVETVCRRVLFLSHGAILLEGDPRLLPREHGKKDLEELFISVAREPLSLHPLAT